MCMCRGGRRFCRYCCLRPAGGTSSETSMAAVITTTTTMVSTESVDPPAIKPFARRFTSSSSSSREGSSDDDGGGGCGRDRTADLPVPSAKTSSPLAARAATPSTTQNNPVAPLPEWSSLQFWRTNGPGGQGGEGKVGDLLAARDGAGDGGMYLGEESPATRGASRTYHCQVRFEAFQGGGWRGRGGKEGRGEEKGNRKVTRWNFGCAPLFFFRSCGRTRSVRWSVSNWRHAPGFLISSARNMTLPVDKMRPSGLDIQLFDM